MSPSNCTHMLDWKKDNQLMTCKKYCLGSLKLSYYILTTDHVYTCKLSGIQQNICNDLTG